MTRARLIRMTPPWHFPGQGLATRPSDQRRRHHRLADVMPWSWYIHASYETFYQLIIMVNLMLRNRAKIASLLAS